MARSSADRKLERSRGENDFGPLVISPALRSESIRLRVASVMPIESSVKARPVGAIAAAPAFTQRLASGMSAVITMLPRMVGFFDDDVASGATSAPVLPE